MIHLKGQCDLSDFMAAQKLHTYRGWLSSCLNYFSIGLMALMTLLVIGAVILGSANWPLFMVPALLLGLGVLGRYVLVPQRLAKLFAQQKDLSAPFEVEIDDAGFHFQNSYGDVRIPWGDFIKWKENQEMLLLYRSDVMFHMLPKCLFQNQGEIHFVLDKLREKKVPQARQTQNFLALAIVLTFIVLAAVIILAQLLQYSGR